MGEARVRTSALSLDRSRFPEQPGAPEEREEDDRGRRRALEALVPTTAPRGSRSRRHRRLLFGLFGESGMFELGCVRRLPLGGRCREHGRSSATEIAQDAIEFRDPDPFFEVGIRSSSASPPRFVRCLRQDDDLRRRRFPANPTDQTWIRVLRDALMQDDRVGMIVPGKIGHIDVRKGDREQFEPRLLHEELHERALQRDRNSDEDPECRVRPCCQTRVLGLHIRSVRAHRQPRDKGSDGPTPRWQHIHRSPVSVRGRYVNCGT